ncbi:hypothetical protein COU76_02395 [Candidatus Peregrinibacteria bacterium CG10_big_fil_rev_8_21_14_0_10_49_10]|nr:MAG: hypothetical protein COU76_02395 [Candidatus Peregrinibacteria bacterium CG10_big_fil_rev_8_21_14_0_10_49_10]
MQLPQFQIHAAIEEKHWWFTARREVFRALLQEVLPPSKETLLLDIGCGTGGNTAAFAQDYRCIGIDPIPEAVTFAKQRFPDCAFICGMVPDDVREKVQKADTVILLDVLEHVEDDRTLAAELTSAVKPGAYLLFVAPADMSLWSPHDEGFEHFRRYDLEGFRALWTNLPVEEVLVSYCNTRLYPVVKMLRLLSRFTGRAWGPSDTDLSVPWRPVNALLHWVFAGEKKHLLRVLHKKSRPYRRGVSVLALLKKQ